MENRSWTIDYWRILRAISSGSTILTYIPHLATVAVPAEPKFDERLAWQQDGLPMNSFGSFLKRRFGGGFSGSASMPDLPVRTWTVPSLGEDAISVTIDRSAPRGGSGFDR